MELIKYSVPTKLDTAPFGTIWKALIGDTGKETYIQLSIDVESPRWEKLGFLLEKAFEDQLQDEKFMNEILKRFKQLEA